MVLHNDKWKYKQKRDYMRKHGLLKKKPNPNEQEADDDLSSSDNEEELKKETGENFNDAGDDMNSVTKKEGEANENNGDDAVTEAPVRRKKKLQNNSWRFKGDLTDEDGIIIDPEILEQIMLKHEEEKRIQQDNANAVLQRLEILGDNVDQFKKPNKAKTANEMSNNDLLNWSLNDNNSIMHENDESFQPKNKSIRVLTEDEKKRFLKMQQDINHMKMIDSMKSKLNPNKHDSKAKVFQLDLESDKDKYQKVLKKSLENNVDKKNIEEAISFEQNINQVLGIDLSDEKNINVDNITFDMNKLMTTKEPSTIKKNVDHPIPKGKTYTTETSPDDDDFLDELLG